MYTLSDITKTGNVTTDNREHAQSITIDTASNNINTILNELPKTKEVTTADGFTGVLQIDINSVKSEVKGYETSSYQLTQTKEYHNLSAPDTSLVPKSINVNGTQYNLANINWNSSSEHIDDAIAFHLIS